ncbi:MAG: chemotaxis protein CheD [Chloroflexota bacterium]|nr:chemotaxis protein CheD [Chloroflexota bacterium]
MNASAAPRQHSVVGLGEVRVSDSPEDSLLAVGLGSCVAVAMYDPRRQVGGMAHVMLPEGRLDQRRRGRVAHSAVKALVDEIKQRGTEPARCWVKIAGGAAMLPGSEVADYWNIGARNVETVKRALERHGLYLRAEDTGGNTSRVVELQIATGRLLVRHGGGKQREL